MRKNKAFKTIRNMLVPGRVYRRADLARYSSNVDRHLAKLVSDGDLRKVAHGIYATPRTTDFGEAPPDTESLVRSFLKDDHFVIYGPSQFNALGLGTTQLYNRMIVFNRKRVGEFRLGDRTFSFHRWREAPRRVTPEFLGVELMNRIDELAEDRQLVLERLKRRLPEFNRRRLLVAAAKYGRLATQRELQRLLN